MESEAEELVQRTMNVFWVVKDDKYIPTSHFHLGKLNFVLQKLDQWFFGFDGLNDKHSIASLDHDINQLNFQWGDAYKKGIFYDIQLIKSKY